MKDYSKLAVWQKAHELTVRTYTITAEFPASETYGLTAQIRRASVSIPSNIAEGCGREGDAELRRFLLIAQGSASELQYQFHLARDLGFLTDIEYTIVDACVDEVRKMLTSLIQKLIANS
jgi:four helix bundle protein